MEPGFSNRSAEHPKAVSERCESSSPLKILKYKEFSRVIQGIKASQDKETQNIRTHFLLVRSVRLWKNFPREEVEASLVETLQTGQDKAQIFTVKNNPAWHRGHFFLHFP